MSDPTEKCAGYCDVCDTNDDDDDGDDDDVNVGVDLEPDLEFELKDSEPFLSELSFVTARGLSGTFQV